MAASHPYRNLRIPDGAPFELRPMAEKGWGMFATRHIDRNEVILKEQPLFVIYYCGGEETLSSRVRDEINHLTDDAKEQLFSLRHNSHEPFDSLEEAFLCNKFTQDGTGYPEDEAMLLLMPLSSKKIPTGTEITFTYEAGLNFLTRAGRSRALGYDCKCQACTYDDAHALYVSDLRRTLLRGMDFLTSFGIGGNPESIVDPALHPIISDPDLRAAATKFGILRSTRFICYLMMPCLLEAEGILGDIDASTYHINLGAFAWAFETPENLEIAILVMEQGTWMERLFVACHLWNRKFAGDHHNMVGWQEEFEMEVTSHNPFNTSPMIEEVD
ncbi:hypothetical protein PG994_002789 [Apiospora phragmitis]|uniref:SET domain-containing protein n=1 Tax=Apiospora phragmitis TaxID=2905665 RepID=A0ABR1W7F3_9PEZI